MFKPKTLAACVLFAAFALPVHATDVALATSGAQPGYGQWMPFNVNDIDSLSLGVEWIDNANTSDPGFGTPLRFTFAIAPGFIGALTVLDAGFAGDTFNVTNFGGGIGNTSAVPLATYDANASSIGDFDAALADPSFSRGGFLLGAGSYSISGSLAQSVLLDPATPLNSTLGGLRLTVSAVPEPSTYALMLAGMALIGTVANRRRG